MALDERDYHSYNLPEHIKEARLRNIKERFKAANPQPMRKQKQAAKPLSKRSINIPLPETRADWLIYYATICLALAGLLWYFG